MHLKRTLLMLVAAVMLLPALAGAQSGQSRVVGTVLDQSGAFVPGATVVVKNEKAGEERTATSTDQGLYVVTNLRPSTYTIRAKARSAARFG